MYDGEGGITPTHIQEDMNKEQRGLFAKDMVDLGNIAVAAMVFGHITAGKPFNIENAVLGVMFRRSFTWELSASHWRDSRTTNMEGSGIIIGLVLFGIIMNIIGWTDYYRNRYHKKP